MARVQIKNEIPKNRIEDWQLCFQKCIYNYDDGTNEEGFRFIWRRPTGSLQAARGQACIPSKSDADYLLKQATEERWYK